MPLIVMVGIPCSGKTQRALQIRDHFQKKEKKVTLLNQESLGFNKNEYYSTSVKEKMLRAALKSEVEKTISSEQIVILDSLNYIKGYRYELYCLVRNSKTTLCVVFCDTPVETARIYLRNTLEKAVEEQQKSKSEHMSMELFQDYHGRLERPNPSNRWDSPTFIVTPQFKQPPFGDIERALYEGKKPRDPVSTKPDIVVDSSFLYQLEKKCNEIISYILTGQGEWIQGQGVGVPEVKKITYKFVKVWTAPELKRVKAEFIKLCKLHPPKTPDEMKPRFVDYLNTAGERES